MKIHKVKRVCVYCGSSAGRDPAYAEAAKKLGDAIAYAGLGLVYGGGNSGLMGIIAAAAAEKGGHITGVMPTSLFKVESAFYEITEFLEVDNFHERKMLMFKLSDAFVALPGGPGTLEELIEQLTWAKLGYHKKPIFIVNTNGFWNGLLDLFKHMNREIYENPGEGLKCIVVDTPEEAIALLLNE